MTFEENTKPILRDGEIFVPSFASYSILYILDQKLGQERGARLMKMGEGLGEEFLLLAMRLMEAVQ